MAEMDDDLAKALDELYAGPRDTFVERRTELARAARRRGERDRAEAITRLRKPGAAAHAVNLLAQQRDPALVRVLDLGAAIRDALERGDPAVRDLLHDRNATVTTAVSRAVALVGEAGEPATRTTSDQIAQTLRAAMASSDAAEQVRSGTLVEPLEEAGLESLESAWSLPAAPLERRPEGRGQRRSATGVWQPEKRAAADQDGPAAAEAGPDRVTDAERDRAAEAERRLRELRVDEQRWQDERDAAEQRHADAAERRTRLEARRRALAAELRQLEDELGDARADETAAEAERRRVRQALRAAHAARTRAERGR